MTKIETVSIDFEWKPNAGLLVEELRDQFISPATQSSMVPTFATAENKRKGVGWRAAHNSMQVGTVQRSG
jgi:hypothetical protein